VYIVLRFTTTAAAPRPCVLQGHAGVSFVGTHGNQLGPSAPWQSGSAPTVTMGATTVAYEVLSFADAGVLPGCTAPSQVATARGLRVYPPEQFTALFAPAVITGVCLTPSVPQTSLAPITATPPPS